MNNDRSERRGRDIFYGLVAIATLIVAIIGATLAYFSMYTQSNEGAVAAQAAVLSINYEDGQRVTAQANELIPSAWEYVKKSYERNIVPNANEIYDENSELTLGNLCLDSSTPQRQICSVYRFTIDNASEQDIRVAITLNNESNGFENLRYALYKYENKPDGTLGAGKWIVTEDQTDWYDETMRNVVTDPAILQLYKCNGEKVSDEEPYCYEFIDGKKQYSATGTNSASKSLFGYLDPADEDGSTLRKLPIIGKNTYELVLYLNETETNQNDEQGAQYQGTIKVEVGNNTGGGRISGTVTD